MKDRMVMVVMHPRDRVWEVLCERTCDLARYLDHIESAELKSRKTTPHGVVRCVHVWRARANVPSVLAHHLDPALLEWTGRTEWRPKEYESHWKIQPRSMKSEALCEGIMRFLPAVGGRATRVEVELTIGKGQGQGPAGLRTITSTILSTHFRRLVDAVTRLIEER